MGYTFHSVYLSFLERKSAQVENVFTTQLERLRKEFREARLSQKIGTRLSDDVYVVCLNLQKACVCLQRMCTKGADSTQIECEKSEFTRYAQTAITLISTPTSETHSPFNDHRIGICAKNIAWLFVGPDEIPIGAETLKSAQELHTHLYGVTDRK